MTTRLIRWFVGRYNVNMDEALDSDITHYTSFNDFFTRALRPGARPIAQADYVCPVDGRISQFGAIDKDQIFQAKGHHFSTTALLAADAAQKPASSRLPMEEFGSVPRNNDPVSLDGPNLDVILDIPVSISMEVGSTDINIRNLLQLNQGSVIELDRLAGEPLDVLVNGTLIAHGEVVVVNEKFGIRLTDVISPSERIKKLR